MSEQQHNPVKRFLELLKPEKREITSIYFFAIFSGLVQLSLPLGVQTIVGLMMGTTMVTSIYLLILIVVLGVFMVGWLQVNQMRIIEKIQQRIFTQVAFDFTEVLPKLKLTKADNYYLPEKTNRFFDIVTVQKGLTKLLLDVPLASIQIIFGLTLLALYHPVFIIFGMILLVVLWFILSVTGKHGIKSSLVESDYKYLVAGWLEEIARVVVAFKYNIQTHLNINRTDDNVVNYLNARTSHFQVLLLQFKTLIVFKVIITFTMLSVGTYLVINQQLNIGEFIAAEIVILTVIAAVEKLISSLDSVYDVITGIDKISSVTDLAVEKSGSIPFQTTKQGISLELQNIQYRYEPQKLILKELNLVIPSNAKVWITGGEGSGKSTLIKLLGACFDNVEGQLLYNQIPASNYELTVLRKNIGLYLNSNDIFLGSLLENITLGNTAIKAQEIMNLADRLGMHDLFKEYPRGFDTIIDPTGRRLSESTSKKILLLRTLIEERPLLILNNPFIGLDLPIQQAIHRYLSELKNTTVLIVSKNELIENWCTHKLHLENGTVAHFNTLK